MNLFADESVEQQIVDRLRSDGHGVLYVAELEPSIPDEIVLRRANELSALLITADKDFGELVYRQHSIHLGVVLIRLSGLSAEAKAKIVSQTFLAHGSEMPSAFAVVSPGLVRIRRGPSV